MKKTRSLGPVVVGIDGSTSAMHAAEWAADEAADRDVALQLIHVIQSTSTDIRQETADAEAALRAAHAAVTRTGQPVKIETAVMRGPVAATLVAESAGAELICVGASGIELRATKLRGAIAAAVVKSAHCPVAIVRTRDDAPSSESDDIAVIVDDASDVGDVLKAALDEARLRNATLLVVRMAPPHVEQCSPEIDQCLAYWLGHYPDVQDHTLVVPGDVPTFLAERDPPVQLIVMGNAGDDAVARMVGPYGRFALRGTECSVLLVRS